MRIPSTSDLVESQTNKAYDKLAVLSENLDKLEDIYDFIFKYYEYLRQRLAQYVTLDQKETITGLKTFQNEVKFLSNVEFPKIDIPHDSDSTYTGKLSVHYADNDGKTPALILALDSGSELARISLGYDTVNNKPVCLIPNTVELANSAVNLSYLQTKLTELSDAFDTKLEALNTKIDSIAYDETVTDDSKNAVQSNGIKAYVDDSLANIKATLEGLIAKVEAATSGQVSDLIKVLVDAGNRDDTCEVGAMRCVGLVNKSEMTSLWLNNHVYWTNDKKTDGIIQSGTTIPGSYLREANYMFQDKGDDMQYTITNRSSNFLQDLNYIPEGSATSSLPALKGNWVLLAPMKLDNDVTSKCYAIRIN
jgi:hypothetical protein